MGIMVTKTGDNDNLTERINADLRRKMSESSSDEIKTDYVGGTDYLAETKTTGRFSWIWLVLIILAIASLVFIIVL